MTPNLLILSLERDLNHRHYHGLSPHADALPGEQFRVDHFFQYLKVEFGLGFKILDFNFILLVGATDILKISVVGAHLTL